MSFLVKSASNIIQNISKNHLSHVLPRISTSVLGCHCPVRKPACSPQGFPYSTVLNHTNNASMVPKQHLLYNPSSTGILLKRINDLSFSAMAKPSNCKGIHTSSVLGGNSLYRMNRIGPRRMPKKKRNPFGCSAPMLKGVVLKTVIKKPRKPNSANRKCVLVRLSNGKELVAFVPREGHSLQEHNVVMVRPGRLRDTPGVKVRCIRGCYDLGHVVKKVH